MSSFKVNGDMFGQYVKIPTGYSRQQHIYKVIGLLESNGYCDVPIVGQAEAKWHEESVPILRVIHCGVCEEEVIRVPLKDCSPTSVNSENYIDSLITRLRNAAGGPEGIKMCMDAAEMISSLCVENTKLRTDTVEVVRCRECKHSRLPAVMTQKYGRPGTLTCNNIKAPCNRRNVNETDFCSYGERRDDDAAD